MAALATEPAFADRMAALEDLAAYLKPRLGERVSLARANPGGSPPTFALVREGEAEPLLSFGLIDTIFFWTFDGGTSCHYSRDRELMSRIIATELARSQIISPPPP
ncbi:MAG: hypothetical protein J0H94_02945 [Rhizobiales bacterium]|nr:hypothetical protein [Hyphomicrobiales bacterium]